MSDLLENIKLVGDMPDFKPRFDVQPGVELAPMDAKAQKVADGFSIIFQQNLWQSRAITQISIQQVEMAKVLKDWENTRHKLSWGAASIVYNVVKWILATVGILYLAQKLGVPVHL